MAITIDTPSEFSSEFSTLLFFDLWDFILDENGREMAIRVYYEILNDW